MDISPLRARYVYVSMLTTEQFIFIVSAAKTPICANEAINET